MGDALERASERIFNLFLELRRTYEAWSDGERGYKPASPDAAKFLASPNVWVSQKTRLRHAIEGIITEELGKVSAEILTETPGTRATRTDAGGTSPPASCSSDEA